MENQKWLRLIGVAALLAALSLVWHFVIYVPIQNNSTKIEYSKCISNADLWYEREWERVCKENKGKQDNAGVCNVLPRIETEGFTEEMEKGKSRCVEVLKATYK
jgi:hypothetical protein